MTWMLPGPAMTLFGAVVTGASAYLLGRAHGREQGRAEVRRRVDVWVDERITTITKERGRGMAAGPGPDE